ncbi:MAG TPA: type VII secretion protein EccB [Trebonia sp.]|jgi:type VII secretion protein EccB|nr:type VII secretion protein EccB [Trebonia sp.]
MPNRKDLLQAHRLMTQRAALALIVGDPDSPDQPLRRRTTLAVCGILAGVIAAAGFGVLGLLSPGTVTGLTTAGTLVIDKNTATPYVPCHGKELCPSLNYASALLALDTANVNEVDVTQSTLSHYQIGPTIGIAGLPQDLPTSGDLVRGPWAVCAANGVSTLVGGVSVGGTPLRAGSAALVTTKTGGNWVSGGDWVLWHGERLSIAPTMMLSLFGGSVTPTSVPTAWLDSLPQGPNFSAPKIQGQGGAANGPAGAARIGQVYEVPGAAGTPTQYYVVAADGKLETVTPVQADLLDREPGANKLTQISPATAAGDLAGVSLPPGGLPATVPAIAATSSPVCVEYGAGLNHSITTGGTVPSGAVPVTGGSGGSGSSGGSSNATTSATDAVGVDQVWLPADHGALVGVAASPNSTSGVASWFLVTGATRYALASPSLAAALGYNLSADDTLLPASVVDLLPQGPVLDPAAATDQAAG